MGASATPPRAEVGVAASGGRDSTALLHATLRAAGPLGVRVHALHVHHGLHPQADAWLRHVRSQSQRWGAVFHAAHLSTAPAPSESVEAWARRERYLALTTLAQAAGCGVVLLAHHRRDQAETVLLQLLRGGGARGLAAMPAHVQRGGIHWLRPWRDQTREAIEAYLRRYRLRWVDDPGNDDERYARNQLQRSVWPALDAAFPQAEAALAQAATRAAEEASALKEFVALDAASCSDGDALRLAAWQTLSPSRQALLLRWQVETWSGRGVPGTLIRRLMVELPRSTSGRWPAPGGWLELRRGALRYQPVASGEGQQSD